jgi:putative transposase
MSRAVSASTGKSYGVKRVCLAWDQARSTFYARKQSSEGPSGGPPSAKRGPKTEISDEELLKLIRTDLAESPFQGEGHRKVWMRLRYVKKHRVGRMRVLRIMRENNLLSPRRSPQGEPSKHDGTITTDAPNEMWGTDGAKIFTLEEGWTWAFVAVEHWSAECVGLHATKIGNRFAALEPISQGLTKHFGSVRKDVARGLSVRMDHGPQYTADDFINQIRYWGITTSFAFVSEPETNGVAERFIRTMKEQAVYGRVFRNVQEVREALEKFVTLYNEQWLLEKNRGRSPVQLRQDWLLAERLKEAA